MRSKAKDDDSLTPEEKRIKEVRDCQCYHAVYYKYMYTVFTVYKIPPSHHTHTPTHTHAHTTTAEGLPPQATSLCLHALLQGQKIKGPETAS